MTPPRRPTVYLLYHFFHPDDVISARLYSELAEYLANLGCEVVAFPATRSCHDDQLCLSSRENWQRITIQRIWRPAFKQASTVGRLLNSLFMLWGWSWKAAWVRRRRQTDTPNCLKARDSAPAEVVIVGTDPIFGVLAAIPWRLFRKRASIVHWCHDLHPEATIADGKLHPQSVLAVSLRSVLRIAYRRCDWIVDLGSCMRGRLQIAGNWQGSSTANPVPRLATITPWSLVEPTEVARPHAETRNELFGDARLTLLYSGNLGRAHEFSSFLDLARVLRGEPSTITAKQVPHIRFCFAGRGVGMAELASKLTAADTNITLTGFTSEECLSQRLSAGDIHLVSLKPAWTGTVVPSKFFGALAIGRPVLFVGSQESSIAKWIAQHGVGWLLTEDNSGDIADELRAISNSPHLLAQLNERCLRVYRDHFSRAVQLQKWKGLVEGTHTPA